MRNVEQLSMYQRRHGSAIFMLSIAIAVGVIALQVYSTSAFIWVLPGVATTGASMRCGIGQTARVCRAAPRISDPNVLLWSQLHDTQWYPMDELDDDRAMLVIVRHGQSEWNLANIFIGWHDSPLTEEGVWEAAEGGRLLANHKIDVEEIHSSMLSRAFATARICMATLRRAGLSLIPDGAFRATWRLNERAYGALTGKNKKQCSKEYGKDKVKIWRRSWDVPPPEYSADCELYKAASSSFRAKAASLAAEDMFEPGEDPPPDSVPLSESLKDTQERVLPYWERVLLPRLQAGKRIMVVAHENVLRALVMHIDDISQDDILEVDIPRALPLVYIFEKDKLIMKEGKSPRLQPVKLTPPDAADGAQFMSSRYLVDQQLISALHKKDLMQVYDTSVEDNLEEVCAVDLDPDMCQTIGEYLNDDEPFGPHGPGSEHRQMIGEPKFVKKGESVEKVKVPQGSGTAFVSLPARQLRPLPGTSVGHRWAAAEHDSAERPGDASMLSMGQSAAAFVLGGLCVLRGLRGRSNNRVGRCALAR